MKSGLLTPLLAAFGAPTDAAAFASSIAKQLPTSARVLDAACGQNELSRNLSGAGLCVSQSEPSALVSVGGVSHVDFAALPTAFGNKELFDAVVLTGDALSQLAVWEAGDVAAVDEQAVLRSGFSSLVAACRGLRAVLKPHGRLFVDFVRGGETSGTYEAERRGLRVVGEVDPVDVRVTYTTDAEAYKRTMQVIAEMKSDGNETPQRTVLNGILVSRKQLTAALTVAGFTNWADGGLAGSADNLTGGVASTGGRDVAYYDRALNWYRQLWNEDGTINWGLYPDHFPAPFADDIEQLMRTKGIGVQVGPNLALRVWMQRLLMSALGGRAVTSLMDVGCGTGRTTIELAKEFGETLEHALGVDPGAENIKLAREFAREGGGKVAERVSFLEGTMSDVNSKARKYSVVWSDGALSHAPADMRSLSYRGIADVLADDGVFMLSDATGGRNSMGAGAQLHFVERLHYSDLWDIPKQMAELNKAGLHVLQLVDITMHQCSSYTHLAKRAGELAESAEHGSEEYFVMHGLARDYAMSAEKSGKGEIGWVLFVCTKK